MRPGTHSDVGKASGRVSEIARRVRPKTAPHFSDRCSKAASVRAWRRTRHFHRRSGCRESLPCHVSTLTGAMSKWCGPKVRNSPGLNPIGQGSNTGYETQKPEPSGQHGEARQSPAPRPTSGTRKRPQKRGICFRAKKSALQMIPLAACSLLMIGSWLAFPFLRKSVRISFRWPSCPVSIKASSIS